MSVLSQSYGPTTDPAESGAIHPDVGINTMIRQNQFVSFAGVASKSGIVIHKDGMGVDDALVAADLDYTVIAAENQACGVEPDGGTVPMPDYQSIIRVDHDGTRTGLAVMKQQYMICQNRTAFSFGQALVDDESAKVVAAAAYGEPKGAQAFLALKLDRALLINDFDVHEVFVLVRNSFNGNAITASIVPIRASTGAQVETMIPGAPQVWKVRHSGDIINKIAEAAAVVRMVENWSARYAEVTSDLLAAPLSVDEFRGLAGKLLPTPKGGGKRSGEEWARRRRELTGLFETGTASGFGRHTKYAAFQAVCEYIDFHAPARGQDAQGVRDLRLVEGSTGKMKQKAWQLLSR